MLIIPAEHPLDWKKPPVLTLLLILLNTLIYFGYQGGDSARQEVAVKTYLDGGLLDREKALFIESFSTRNTLTDPQRKSFNGAPRVQLAQYILSDLQFENTLHHTPAYKDDPAWQAARAKAEAARNQMSNYRFGFIPAKFTVQGLFGAMFLHADFGHLAGNMLFLFIFGFALERALGRVMYLSLYLVSGLASHLLWWVMDPVWATGIGASGAIAGLMGMYLGIYGLRKINFFYWLGPMFGYFRAPALWILPIWMGKELYGLLLANDHVNYYAHLGGMGAGFLAVWLPRQIGGLKVDEAYLNKVDLDAPFKREVIALDALIGSFALEQAATRGLELLTRYPGRLLLLERLYPVAKTREDKALLGAVLKQFFALPGGTANLPLLQRLADDIPHLPLLSHPTVLLHLLQGLLQARETPRALSAWRKLSHAKTLPAQMPALTLQLAKQLGQNQDVRSIVDLNHFLRTAYPEAEQTQQLAVYQQHIAR